MIFRRLHKNQFKKIKRRALKLVKKDARRMVKEFSEVRLRSAKKLTKKTSLCLQQSSDVAHKLTASSG